METFPDVIIHTAAVSSPQACSADPQRATALNQEATAYLGTLAHHLSARCIYISTNMVFGKGGHREGVPYREEALPCPLNVYGTLKHEGGKGTDSYSL